MLLISPYSRRSTTETISPATPQPREPAPFRPRRRMRRESRRTFTLGELPERRQRSCCWPSIASIRLHCTAHPSHRPTTDCGSASDSGWTDFFSSHPPPPQFPLPTDEGVPRTDTLTPPTTRDEVPAPTVYSERRPNQRPNQEYRPPRPNSTSSMRLCWYAKLPPRQI